MDIKPFQSLVISPHKIYVALLLLRHTLKPSLSNPIHYVYHKVPLYFHANTLLYVFHNRIYFSCILILSLIMSAIIFSSSFFEERAQAERAAESAESAAKQAERAAAVSTSSMVASPFIQRRVILIASAGLVSPSGIYFSALSAQSQAKPTTILWSQILALAAYQSIQSPRLHSFHACSKVRSPTQSITSC